MTLNEQLAVFTGADRVRIYKDKQLIFTHFKAMLYHYEEVDVSGDEEVKKVRFVPEIRHKDWEKLGLAEPMQPDRTPDYEFSDLQLTLYYDIYI